MPYQPHETSACIAMPYQPHETSACIAMPYQPHETSACTRARVCKEKGRIHVVAWVCSVLIFYVCGMAVRDTAWRDPSSNA
jgi:hypothetical protein